MCSYKNGIIEFPEVLCIPETNNLVLYFSKVDYEVALFIDNLAQATLRWDAAAQSIAFHHQNPPTVTNMSPMFNTTYCAP